MTTQSTILSLDSLDVDEIEAFVELMFLAAYIDGTVNDAERAAFRGQVLKGTHGQLQGDTVDHVVEHVERSLPGENREVRLASIRDRLRDGRKRRAALEHAARVILADGVLGVDEVSFLRRAVVALGEPVDLAEILLREARDAAG
jgi:uncharacterized tellurite resistance protein B-like protein